jgi:glycosyltransferase involved in cell wall biosynthesis
LSAPGEWNQTDGVVPEVSVIISTRNRPDHIAPCLESILANPAGDFELIVVDQSSSDDSHRAAASLFGDSRLRWISSKTKGLSISRNIGVTNARAAVLLFTDDDCRVSPEWVSGTRDLFARDPEAALVFGSVLRAANDGGHGFAAEFDPGETREYQHTLPHVLDPWGIGANMAIRRRMLDRIGGFDPALGAGAVFRGGEDADIAIRALAAGFKVTHTSGVTVTHLGVRYDANASQLMRGYGIGLGATLAKHVRLGTRGAGRLLASWIAFHGHRGLMNIVRGQRPTGVGLVAFGIWGAGVSLAHAIDRRDSVYKPGENSSE